MLRIVIFFLANLLCITQAISTAHAIVDPLSVPNNKFGIHILFTTELAEAAKLVNSNGGDWGYVTIPIQAGDKNIEKWQRFMNEARELHITPIIRLAAENYYFDTTVWRKPQEHDVLDFANFLNSLDWPLKNKYIVVYNEVNRGDEWQGDANPKEYAQVLSYAAAAFKSLDEDFFIISAGLDNASANVFQQSINQYDFMYEMNEAVPGIFGEIDGLASHSYPNPAFSQPPWILTDKSVGSFVFERDLGEKLGGKNLPVFITETGWSRSNLSENKIESYMRYAFERVWSDNSIVAVTPFLLRAGFGPYSQFSLINEDGSYNKIYILINSMAKTRGKPQLMVKEEAPISKSEKLPIKTFKEENQYYESITAIDKAKITTEFLKWFLKSLNVL